jgi:dTDP-4-amino-4,6-dideoxygalactose transaminase
MKTIPYGRQYIDSKDIRLVSKALKEDLITTGRYVKKFENKISNFLKVKYAASCNSGTSALHLALMAINLQKDEVIIMPAINFIAVYNMARLMNAKIFLADVDPLTGQMTPETLLECIKNNNLKRIKAIVTMYLGGYPENVIEFYNIKKKYKCFLIEDACHAFGARYKYRNKKFYIGACKHSDLATFSFHPVKTLTTGEGGIVTTNNKILANKVLLFRSHGIKRKKNKHWEYNIQNLGFNYRLSDINSALGLSQLSKIKKFINYRYKIYKSYQKFLINNAHIILPKYNKKNDPAYHLFLISIKSNSKLIKNKLFNFLIKKKIFAQYHYIPIYRFICFREKNSYKKFPNSEYYYRNTLSIPFFYNLSLKNQNYVLNKIKIFFEYFK